MTGNWKRDLWLDALARARGQTVEPLPWMTLPAIGQMTVTRPEMLRAFSIYNRQNPGKRVRPFNFVSVAYARPFGEVDPPRPVAPFANSPPAAREADWVDLRTGKEIRIDPGDLEGMLEPSTCSVRTYGEIAREHRMRPEHKFAAPDGGPCLRATSGLLRRQRIEVLCVEHLGKEGNLLRPDGEVPQQANEVQEVYFDEAAFQVRIVPILRCLPRSEIATFAKVSERGLRDILALRSKPRPHLRQALIQFAIRRSH